MTPGRVSTMAVRGNPGYAAAVNQAARKARGDVIAFMNDDLVVCLGDNIFERSQSEALRSWGEQSGCAQIFVKEVPDPESFGVVVYGDDGRVTDIVEKAGSVDLRYETPPSDHASTSSSAESVSIRVACGVDGASDECQRFRPVATASSRW